MASRSAANWRPKIPNLLVLDREFETQSVDPMFLEPESGLAWYDRKSGKPRTRAWRAVALRGRGIDRASARQARAPFKPARINAQFTYVGGGFGGRDHTPFVLYVGAGGDVLPRPSGAAGA